MSDDYDDFDQEFDSAFLKEIDAIEAASNVPAPPPTSKVPSASSNTTSSLRPASSNAAPTKAGPTTSNPSRFKPASVPGPSKPGPAQQPAQLTSKATPAPHDTSFDEYDISLDIDASELARLDEFISDSYAGKAQPMSGPSRPRQTTLDGSVYNPPSAPQPSKPASTSNRAFERTKSAGSRGSGPLFGFAERRTKTWDRTQFAETGFRSKPAEKQKQKAKEKENADGNIDEDWDEEMEFEQFPARQVTSKLQRPLLRDSLN